VTLDDAGDAVDVPPAFVAVAVKVYGVPFVRPVTVHEPDAPVTVHVAPPGLAVIVNEAVAAPDPATTETVAEALPATAVGAAGTAAKRPPVVKMLLEGDPQPVPAPTPTNRPLRYANPPGAPPIAHGTT
jgi:hypothetical protein